MIRRSIERLVNFAGRAPWVVLSLSLAFVAVTWIYARMRLELRTDLVELLPQDSPAFQSYQHQRGRVAGEATFSVVAVSPDRKANEKFIDDLYAALEKGRAEHVACLATCKKGECDSRCGEGFISHIERGTKELQSFFDSHRWLYASLSELEEADSTLDHQIAVNSGLVSDLEDDGPSEAPAKGGAPVTGEGAPAKSLGMDRFYDKWTAAAKKHNDFPSGYFSNDDGTITVLRIISSASGTGGSSGDRFLKQMQDRIAAMQVTSRYNPKMEIGFAGDIPNAVAEKDSTLGDVVWALIGTWLLVVGGIMYFYRSLLAPLIVLLPALMGIGAAYAFAAFTFGYVNLPGAFLGAIILGNGINYPIVLFSRYREFVARGMEREVARREAVLNAFRAELVGALVASIAYGSLTITQFRGFSQFGTIGFVGMLLVWLAIIPVVPALIVLVERLEPKLPLMLREKTSHASADGSSGAFIRGVARVTARYPVPFVIATLVLVVFAAWRIPAFLKDPWEYNFDKLGSRESKHEGPGEWSNRADEVFHGKQNISGTLILADTREQVPLVKAKIEQNDKADPQGKLIEEIVTVDEFLPGTDDEQAKKADVIARIRGRLTPRVLADLSEKERAHMEEMMPPGEVSKVAAKDLPDLIRRRFEEKDGRIGTPLYVKYKYGVSFSDGRTLLRMAKTTDNVTLEGGTVVQTASRATVFAEMIRSMERDGPLATTASFLAVMLVVVVATRNAKGAIAVLLSLLFGVTCLLGTAVYFGTKLNFFNFIALPITFGIGCEYPFNVYDRTRLLGGDVETAVSRTGGAVALCSYTTVIGYASLLISDQQALQSFGRLAMFGEISCVALALLFLPSLLNLLRKKTA